MKKQLFVCCFILLTLLLGCKKPPANIDNLNGGEIGVIGHGGMGIYSMHTFNSKGGFEKCIKVGADGVEFDVQMTKDQQLVVFHNKDLSTKTNGEGLIKDNNWSDIKDLHYKNSNDKILHVDSLFAVVAEDKLFSVDCKYYSEDAAYLSDFTDALVAMANKYNLENNAYFCVNQLNFATLLLEKKADLRIFAYTDIATALQWQQIIPIKGIIINWADISKTEVDDLHQKGLQVAVFNTKTPQNNIDAVEKNVDFIETDRVIHLSKFLDD